MPQYYMGTPVARAAGRCHGLPANLPRILRSSRLSILHSSFVTAIFRRPDAVLSPPLRQLLVVSSALSALRSSAPN
jgi:hypothetical protein